MPETAAIPRPGVAARRGRKATSSAPKRIGRAQVETIVASASAIAGLVFGLQTIAVTLAQLPMLHPIWGAVAAGTLYLSLAVIGVAALVRRLRRTANAVAAAIYLLSLVLWPLYADPATPLAERPWLYFLCNVATACAAVAFPTVVAGLYAVVAAIAFGVLSVQEVGGGSSLSVALIDVCYAMILGFVILMIITMLRNAGDAVDRSQAAALESYLAAVRQDAIEAERLQVDALVHDSVLTTLLSAAKAESPEQQRLVARMARNAIGNLGDPEDPVGATDPVPVRRFAEDLAAAVLALSPAFAVQMRGTAVGTLPPEVAEALSAAAVQAAVNSLQHAGDADTDADPIERSLLVQRNAEGVLLVQLVDTGRGFDPGTVPPGRLGLRVSIRERTTAVGGQVRLDSAPGRGTSISLSWQQEASR